MVPTGLAVAGAELLVIVEVWLKKSKDEEKTGVEAAVPKLLLSEAGTAVLVDWGLD